jgi:hypothetical protein
MPKQPSGPPCPRDVYSSLDDGYVPCALSKDHVGPCRTKHAVDASNSRRRDKYRARQGGVIRERTEGRALWNEP